MRVATWMLIAGAMGLLAAEPAAARPAVAAPARSLAPAVGDSARRIDANQINMFVWNSGPFAWDPRYPVAWGSDLGMRDSTTFWFWQQIGGRTRIINFFEGSGVDDVGWYAKRLMELPYVYGRGLLPHDGGHKRLGMAGSIADQMRPYNVTVNAIAPGDTRTERFLATRTVDPQRLAEEGTLDRIATVDEVARVVEFFAGPMGAFVSGQVIRIDGGGQAWPA